MAPSTHSLYRPLMSGDCDSRNHLSTVFSEVPRRKYTDGRAVFVVHAGQYAAQQEKDALRRTKLCQADDTAGQSVGVVWQCPCGAYNQLGRYICASCGKNFAVSDSRPARRVLSLTSAHFSHGTAVIAVQPACSGTARNPTSRQCQYCGRGSSCDCDRFRDGRV